MSEPRPLINVEETIGKQVGRRNLPADPLFLRQQYGNEIFGTKS